MDFTVYTTYANHLTNYVPMPMDALRTLELLPALTRHFAGFILELVGNFKSRSIAIGYIFMLLIVTSIVESFVMGVFRLIRIILIVALAFLLGAELFKWLLISTLP